MFKITSLATFLFSFVFVFNGVFNGAGYTKPTMILNVSRLWLLRIPLTYILAGKVYEHFPAIYNLFPRLFDSLANIVKPYSYDSLFWAMVISNLIISLLGLSVYLAGGWKRTEV